jgi:S1-C subfamily serine protease
VAQHPARLPLLPLSPTRRVVVALAVAGALLWASVPPDDATPRELVPLDGQGEMAEAPLPPLSLAEGFAAAMARVGPAVVTITLPASELAGSAGLFLTPRQVGRGEGGLEETYGSGVIVHPEGWVLTNDHVVGSALEVGVTLQDGRQLRARVVGRDPRTDIAVLRLRDTGPEPLPAARPGQTGRLRVGEFAIAIGNPFGLGQTATLGVISALGRDDGWGGAGNLIQTDAALNPGNSGGALINARGEVVGISVAVMPDGVEGNAGIGFAVPIATALGLMDELRREPSVEVGRGGRQPRRLVRSPSPR